MICVSTTTDIKALLRLGEGYDVKNEKIKKDKKKRKTKMTSSPRQGLNPDHGPQHGAVRCSTH